LAGILSILADVFGFPFKKRLNPDTFLEIFNRCKPGRVDLALLKYQIQKSLFVIAVPFEDQTT
jgi:hypothetical protein